MTQRLRYLCMLFACCILFFAGCEVKEMEPAVSNAPIPALGEGDCVLQNQFWFPLEHNTPQDDPRGEYEFKLKTGAFYTDHCLCQADRYEIDFTTIPTGVNLYARNEDGDTIPSTLISPDPMVSDVYTLVVVAFEDMDDDYVTLYVDFDTPLDPLPSVSESGGLCIVENYGGFGDPPTLYTSPIRVQTNNYPPGTGYTDEIWLPTAIATQMP